MEWFEWISDGLRLNGTALVCQWQMCNLHLSFLLLTHSKRGEHKSFPQTKRNFRNICGFICCILLSWAKWNASNRCNERNSGAKNESIGEQAFKHCTNISVSTVATMTTIDKQLLWSSVASLIIPLQLKWKSRRSEFQSNTHHHSIRSYFHRFCVCALVRRCWIKRLHREERKK